MKPIKLADFLAKSKAKRDWLGGFELAQVGMTHAAPSEADRPIRKMRYDAQTGRLQTVS